MEAKSQLRSKRTLQTLNTVSPLAPQQETARQETLNAIAPSLAEQKETAHQETMNPIAGSLAAQKETAHQETLNEKAPSLAAQQGRSRVIPPSVPALATLSKRPLFLDEQETFQARPLSVSAVGKSQLARSSDGRQAQLMAATPPARQTQKVQELQSCGSQSGFD